MALNNFIGSQNWDEKIAVVTDQQQISWVELQKLANHYSQLLPKSKRTALFLNQDISSIALLVSTAYRNEMDFILIPYFYKPHKIAEWLKQHHLEYFITVKSENEFNVLINPQIKPHSELISNENFICLLTSGTTGTPKIIRHTWNSLTEHVVKDPKYTGGKWLLCYPLAHFAGLQVIAQCMGNEGTLIVPQTFDPNTIHHLIVKNQPDYINCTPTLMRQLLQNFKISDFENINIKNITLGGEVVDQNTINLIKKYLPRTHVSHIYASTEIGTLIQVNDEKEGFPLKNIDNIRLKIVDNKLFVRKSLRSMTGYLGSETLNETDWIDTKDIIEITGDRVLFHGREDDMINVGGFKVSPVVVEKIIKELPSI